MEAPNWAEAEAQLRDLGAQAAEAQRRLDPDRNRLIGQLAEALQEVQHLRDEAAARDRRMYLATGMPVPGQVLTSGAMGNLRSLFLGADAAAAGDVHLPNAQPLGNNWNFQAQAQVASFRFPSGRVDPERQLAESRALALLEAHVGRPAMGVIRAGGGYPIPSKLWKDVVYVIPPNSHTMIRVLHNGALVTESCLVSDDPNLPWPDLMLQRIKAIQASETIVYETGVVHDRQGHVKRAAYKRLWGRIQQVIKFSVSSRWRDEQE